MNLDCWWSEFTKRIEQYDLLRHPFYIAWSMGELSASEISQYAAHYYHHVKAFPEYLQEFENRLPDGALKSAVRKNRQEENGHADLWLDFAEGMGGNRHEVPKMEPLPEVRCLTDSFFAAARNDGAGETLAQFYAYESQVPRVAKEKGQWLQEIYKSDEKTRFYFTVHETADEHHAAVWRGLIEKELTNKPESSEAVLAAGERAAKALWQTLDGMQKLRGMQTTAC